ncbi:MAG: 50S ribosomal protein L20 [Patescibacteria group bacterium]|nr:50S ribosomal protein L20 [Patescibacteria group bacterium]
MTSILSRNFGNKKKTAVLKHTKGFRWGRKSKEKAAKEALLHAWSHAYRGRKENKRDQRQLWNVKINAASREEGVSYSKLVSALKKNNILLNRKVLSELAEKEPEAFKKILAKAK